MAHKNRIFINYFKGIFIGVGAIIPGLSGGTAAIIAGLFEGILESTANFFIHTKKSVVFLTPIVLGVGVGIVIFSPVLNFFSTTLPIASKYSFCVISVISTICFVRKSLTLEYTKKKVISTICGIITALLLSFSLRLFQTNFSNSGFLTLFIVALPLALALILPAISFSYMLLFFGLYNETLDSISNFDFGYLFPLFLGIAVGTLFFSKLLLKLINKHPQETYSYVLGFVLYSVADILMK